jgi:hypothetical protein
VVTELGFGVVGGGRPPPVIEEVVGVAVGMVVGSGVAVVAPPRPRAGGRAIAARRKMGVRRG